MAASWMCQDIITNQQDLIIISRRNGTSSVQRKGLRHDWFLVSITPWLQKVLPMLQPVACHSDGSLRHSVVGCLM